MALVQYSDSDSDSESDFEDEPASLYVRTPPRKKPRTADLPPLPTGFRDLYAASTRLSVRDDPSLHGGRKRVIPHVEGNWPTHIYLEWYPLKTEVDVLSDVLEKCRAECTRDGLQIHSLLHSDLGVQLPLHISLSRPVVLATEQKQSFIDVFEQALHRSGVRSFNAVPETLDWVSNSEKTRWFLVMRIKKPPNDELNSLLRISNQTLAAFDQPPLYASTESITQDQKRTKAQKNPSRTGRILSSDRSPSEEDFSDRFHISLAWSLNEPSLEDNERVSKIDLQPLKRLHIVFNSVKVKIGNVVKSFDLYNDPS